MVPDVTSQGNFVAGLMYNIIRQIKVRHPEKIKQEKEQVIEIMRKYPA